MARQRKTSSKSVADQVADNHKKPLSRRERKAINPFTLVPTGSTMLNLVQSDRIEGGWQLGKVENLVGDSQSGKSILALSGLAACMVLPHLKDHRLIYDDVEQASEFDIGYLFGDLEDKLEAPAYDKNDEPVMSDTIQDTHFHILDALEKRKPFIYVLDSLDLTTAEEDQKKIKEQHTAHKKGNATAGTYGMAKPKYVSWMLRDLKKKFKTTNSMLLIISQTRDNIDPMSFEKKTRAGGKALKFAACHETWLAMAGKIPSKKMIIGNKAKTQCKKNKITGKVRDCSFSIYYDYGVDDIGSMIDFLVVQEYWKKKKETIIAHDFDMEAGLQKLTRMIERGNLESELKQIVQKVWNEREESLRIHRKPRF